MDPARYQRVKEIFLAAFDLAAEERGAHLERACGTDAELRREVETLFAQAGGVAGFLDQPVDLSELGVEPRSAAASAESGPAAQHPPRIGRYRILSVLGEGGMGVVYLAEQDHPRREVALKVVKPGFLSERALKRFEREAQVLALLHHPGIAQVYDTGTADAGAGPQPYFAMERVSGRTLGEAAASLGRRARLELFAKICDALEHAHRRGVVHRDLKPANVLVDERGEPKVLDFGVARLTDADVQLTSLNTAPGAVVGTLPYMSPEQVAGTGADVDARSDVYALGVLLYELLSGRLPYDVLGRPVIEAARTISEADPRPLSTADRSLRGDPETIVGKALEKDPTRRYATAADLAADVRAHLRDEPIAARPASTAYQLRKFARRHKALVGGAVAVVVALALGVVGTTIGMFRARAAERVAQGESDQAQAITEFTWKLFAASDPSVDGRDVRVVDLLDRWTLELDGRFVDQPAIEATLRERLGQTYHGLGLFDKAEPQLRRALELWQKIRPADHAAPIRARNNLGTLLTDRGAHEEAEQLLRDVWQARRRTLGDEDPESLKAAANLAAEWQSQGRVGEAEELQRQVLEIQERTLGETHEDTLQALGNLALLLASLGRVDEAAPLVESLVGRTRTAKGLEHPETLNALNTQAIFLQTAGRPAEARAVLEELLRIGPRVLDENHPQVVTALNNLAVMDYEEGALVQAEQRIRRVIDIRMQTLGEKHENTLTALSTLGRILLSLGRTEEAELELRRACDTWMLTDHDRAPNALTAKANLAAVLAEKGELEESALLYREAYDAQRAILAPSNSQLLANGQRFAQVLMRLERLDEAEEVAREVAEASEIGLGPTHPTTLILTLDLAGILVKRSRLEEAENRLLAMHGALVDLEGTDSRIIQRMRKALVDLYEAFGRPDEAAKYRSP